jgi:hypothetical protein
MYNSKKERKHRDYSLLGCNTVQSCGWIKTFQNIKALPLFRVEPEEGNSKILRNA